MAYFLLYTHCKANALHGKCKNFEENGHTALALLRQVPYHTLHAPTQGKGDKHVDPNRSGGGRDGDGVCGGDGPAGPQDQEVANLNRGPSPGPLLERIDPWKPLASSS